MLQGWETQLHSPSSAVASLQQRARPRLRDRYSAAGGRPIEQVRGERARLGSSSERWSCFLPPPGGLGGKRAGAEGFRSAPCPVRSAAGGGTYSHVDKSAPQSRRRECAALTVCACAPPLHLIQTLALQVVLVGTWKLICPEDRRNTYLRPLVKMRPRQCSQRTLPSTHILEL